MQGGITAVHATLVYWENTEESFQKIEGWKTQGLVPVFINPDKVRFKKGATLALGPGGDSYYEYLLKQWIQSGHTIDYLRDDFLESVTGVKTMK